MNVSQFNREQVAQRALASTVNVPNTCQMWTRDKAGAPSVGDFDGDGQADAEDGWKSEPSKYKHPGDRRPPRGTIVRWLGGSNDNGHAAVSLGPNAAGVYMIRSTDAGGRGVVASVPLSWVEQNWHLQYAGWSDTCDGWLILPAPKPEPKPVPARKGADFAWYQPGKIGSPESGCVLGVSKDFGTLTNTKMFVGSPGTKKGGGIRRRPILRGRATSKRKGVAFGAMAGHPPPPRAPKARAAYLKEFAKRSARFKGGDTNVSQRVFARITGRSVVGNGVLWLTVPRAGWKVLNSRAVDVGGDHKAVLVRMQHKKTKSVTRFLVINAMSVSASKAKSSEIFANGLALNPHIVMGSECADFRAAKVDARK